ncbi:hypothetical protein [Pollutibacter soli]|uniref:hypothetical protein n=1 Tax=Pollutibacter soli TaxID=3034157 RepID=UPI003013987E
MTYKTELTLKYNTLIGNFVSCTFGMIAAAIGVLNMFWGNDPFFGIFIFFLAFLFFPPLTQLIKRITGFSLSPLAKMILALFILWISLGVGELLGKIDLMLKDF